MNLAQVIGTHVQDATRDAIDKARWGWVANQIGQWTVEYVRVAIEYFDPVRFEEWHTQGDERTCPICGQLDGLVWEEGEGFTPPVHDHCRCQRLYHHVELNKRIVEEWQQQRRWETRTEWEWKRTA